MRSVKDRIKEQPDLFLRLTQSSLTVAKSLRNKYVENTFLIADKLREFFEGSVSTCRLSHIKNCNKFAGSITASFIDGGIGDVEIFLSTPLVVRGAIFRIKEGERDLQKRETFEFFPVLVGDLEGGEKSRQDFGSVVRIIIELGSVIRTLTSEKFVDVNLILLHGPLLYRLSAYSDHWFFENDLYTLLDPEALGVDIISEFNAFKKECSVTDCWCALHSSEKRIKANCIISMLLNKAINLAIEKNIPLVGVVERASATEVLKIALQEYFRSCPEDAEDLIKQILGLSASNYAKDINNILASYRLDDPIIFSLILEQCEFIDYFVAKERYEGFSGQLKGFEASLPKINYTYLKTNNNVTPMRVEFPGTLSKIQMDQALTKVYEYASLLPRYAFPIGLDIADKFAKVPKWLTEAYRKFILFNFGRVVKDEQLNQEELYRLVTFYFLNERKFFNRP